MENYHKYSILLGLLNMLIGWSIVLKKMLHFSYVAIFSNQILENKKATIPLLVWGSQIGRKMKDSIFMLAAPLVLIIKLGENVKSY